MFLKAIFCKPIFNIPFITKCAIQCYAFLQYSFLWVSLNSFAQPYAIELVKGILALIYSAVYLAMDESEMFHLIVSIDQTS